jgi:hypothetical protein
MKKCILLLSIFIYGEYAQAFISSSFKPMGSGHPPKIGVSVPKKTVEIKTRMEVLKASEQAKLKRLAEFDVLLNSLLPDTIYTKETANPLHEKLKEYIGPDGKFPRELAKEELLKIKRSCYIHDDPENFLSNFNCPGDVMRAVYNSSNHEDFYEALPLLKPKSGEGIKTAQEFESDMLEQTQNHSKLAPEFTIFINSLTPGIVYIGGAESVAHKKLKVYILLAGGIFPKKLSKEDLLKIRRAYFSDNPSKEEGDWYYSPHILRAAYNSSYPEDFYAVFPFAKPESGVGVRIIKDFGEYLRSEQAKNQSQNADQ